MTLRTFYPNGTISTGGTTQISGGTQAHEVLSVNDVDYYWGPITTSTAWALMDLGTATLPANAVVRVVATNVIARSYTGISNGTWKLDILNADGTVVYRSGSGTLTGTYATRYGGQSTSPLPTTQALVDELRLRLELTGGQAYLAYVQLGYVEQPVVTHSAVTPDPATTTQPTLAWTRTLDGDGGYQTHYEVKVFTAAQYGAGGFNPDTSIPHWGSGITFSGAASRVSGPLLNSTTYRSYVRIAQTVNGVPHWSAWSYDQFTVTVTTTDVSTVVPVADSANARVGVTVTRGGAIAWDKVEVQRSDDAGATWTYVRGARYVDATGNANTFVVQDYESSNGATILYRARATRIVPTDQVVTGAWVTSSSITSWTSSKLWVKDPTNPSLNTSALRLETTISPTHPIRSGVYSVLGVSTPIVLSDMRSAAQGTLTLLATSKSESDAILTLAQGNVLLIQPPTTWDMDAMYVALGPATQVRSKKVRTAVSRWTFTFVEVAAPADAMAGV